MYSQVELEKQSADNRKVKPLHKRKAKIGSTPLQLTKLAAKRSGFQINSTGEVIDAFCEVLKERLLEGKSVTIKGVGTISPIVKKARPGVDFGRHSGEPLKKIIIEPRFELKLFVNDSLEVSFKKIKVSPADIENIFIN